MADLLTLDAQLRIHYATSVDPGSSIVAPVNEPMSIEMSVQNRTQDSFALAADVVAYPLPALPHQPYNVLFLYTDTAIKININAQGNQIIQAGGFLTMALVASCTLTNDQIPEDGDATVVANIRYLALKQSA